MKSSINEILIPQKEEDIEEIVWADKQLMHTFCENTYPSIVEVIAAYQIN
jgi:hypothetical protein